MTNEIQTTKPGELTTVLPPFVHEAVCECGQLILYGFAGYYDPRTEKVIRHCPDCGQELSLMTTRPVRN